MKPSPPVVNLVSTKQTEVEKTIHQAAKEGKVLRIKYTDRLGKHSVRNVEPYEIRDGKLWAYARNKKGIRQFNLANINEAKITHYLYFPKWPVKLLEDPMTKKASYDNPWLYNVMDFTFGVYEHASLE